ncbi:MAG TPA: hypothetical protein VHU84_07980 [Lacipirellulaceae bacterium]|jgi:hypothetical protein|nr:hypothetical protein [Lacipirellulaceae bacterium]
MKLISALLVFFSAAITHAQSVQGLQGLIPGSREAASSNTARLNKALTTNSRFIRLPVGTFYINGPIETQVVNGCGRIATDGSFGYVMDYHGTLSGSKTQIVQLTPGAPVFRLRGAGFVLDDPIELVETGGAAIEIEGRGKGLACGRHSFRHLMVRDCTYAFRCLPGYYEQGKLIPDEEHADICTVQDSEFCNVESVFRSENQQSLDWTFTNITVNVLGHHDRCIVADILRGGFVRIEGLNIEHPRTTIFRVRDFSPNQCYMTCHGIHGDRAADGGANDSFTLFEYNGDPKAAAWSKWYVDFTGFVATYQTKFDKSVLLRVPANLPTDGIDYKGLKGLPE